MLSSLRALLLSPLLAYGTVGLSLICVFCVWIHFYFVCWSQNEEIIRVAVIWETNEFSEGSKYSSSFMDGFYFFSEQLKKKQWVAKLGEAVTYKMEMHTFDPKFDSNKIRTEFLDKIGNGQMSLATRYYDHFQCKQPFFHLIDFFWYCRLRFPFHDRSYREEEQGYHVHW